MKKFIDTTLADAKSFVRAVRQRTGTAKPKAKTEEELRREARERVKARGMLGQGGVDGRSRRRAVDSTLDKMTGESRAKKKK